MPGGMHPSPEVISSWPEPNYSDPVTRPRTILFLACFCVPLAVGTLLARIWARKRIQRRLEWDDWLMSIAIVPVIALTIIFAYVTEAYEFNKHIWDVNPKYHANHRKWILAIEILFCVGSGLIKISILLFYRRISPPAISPTFRVVIHICIGSVAIYSSIFVVLPLLVCRPISAFWDQMNHASDSAGYHYKCVDEGVPVFAAGVISAVQDALTTTLPAFAYWGLQISAGKKAALFGIFSIGYGTAAIGALRAYLSWYIFFRTYDVAWYIWEIFLLLMLELHLGTLCANAPGVKLFLSHTFGSKQSNGGYRPGPSRYGHLSERYAVNPLPGKGWYHGDVSRLVAEQMNRTALPC